MDRLSQQLAPVKAAGLGQPVAGCMDPFRRCSSALSAARVAKATDCCCRTPGSQAKLSQAVKDELDAAQEQAKLRKQQRDAALYDKKMMDQQTQSALRTGCV